MYTVYSIIVYSILHTVITIILYTNYNYIFKYLRGMLSKRNDTEEDSSILQLISYYDAMNAQDLTKVLTFLDDEVVVTFPENERNWSGKVC